MPSSSLVAACQRLEGKARQQMQSATRVKVGIIDDPQIAEYATYQEYGWVQRVTPKQHGWFSHRVSDPPSIGAALVMPARPFLRASVNAYAQKWANVFARAMQMTDGNAAASLQMVGQEAVTDVKQTIANGGTPSDRFAPRAPLTMELNSLEAAGHKTDGTGGVSGPKPLFKSGAMLNAVGYALESGGVNG